MAPRLSALALALLACAGPATTPPTYVEGSDADDGTWFEDVTEEAGLAFARGGTADYGSLADRLAGGVCVIDADGAPPLDLFFALHRHRDPRGSLLFVADHPWEYADETEARGLGSVGNAIGCLAFDSDGDGDDDLLVTGVGRLRLFEQRDGTFVDRSDILDVTIPPMHLLTSASAADHDGDGDLELVVGGFVDLTQVPEHHCRIGDCDLVIPETSAVQSYLLRRTARGYDDLTPHRAHQMRLPEPTLVVGSPDVDGDGIPEIYLGNDFGAHFFDRVLVRGPDGVLRDEAERLGMAYDAAGHGIDTMGWASGDVDGDGRFDYAMTSFAGFHSPMFFCAEDWCEDRGRSVGMDAVRDSFRWGNALADFDLDGDVDLLTATGHLFTESEGEALGSALEHAQRPSLLVNDGEGMFTPVEPSAGGALARRWPARGITVADLDDDGRLDVVLATAYGPPAVLRNRRTARGSFLRIRLIGRPPNAGAVGAVVRVHASGETQMRRRLAGQGYLGSFGPRLSFGGLDGPVDVEVRWPSGLRTRASGVSPGGEITLREPAAE